jgi:hypothetical protein
VGGPSHRRKCERPHESLQMAGLLVNPDNPYHWLQIKQTVAKELRESSQGCDPASRLDLDQIYRRAHRPAGGAIMR